MFKIFKYFKWQDYISMLGVLIIVIGQVWLELEIPEYVEGIMLLFQSPTATVSDIWAKGLKMLLCTAGIFIGAIGCMFLISRFATNFARRLRFNMYKKVSCFSMAEINQFSTASLITRSTNDITQIQMFLAMGLHGLFRSPILAIWAIIKISTKNWQWTLATGCAVAFLLISVITIVLIALPKFKRIQGLTDDVNKVARENLTGVRVVRAYNAEGYQEDKFNKVNNKLTDTYLSVGKVMMLLGPCLSLLMMGISLAIYWIGAGLINAELDPFNKWALFGEMAAFSTYAMQIIMSFVMLLVIFVMLPRASVSAKRINEVLDTPLSIKDGTFTGETKKTGEVEFKNVSFKYPDAEDYVLENISFTAKKGETVAFIGSTGSGKSTLINLVPRFYDATEGEILIDGINIKEYKKETLNNKIGYVPQKAVMFSGSVSSNVAYGDNGKEDADIDQIKKAVDIAQAKEFVEKMEEGYDSHIARGGTNVSGGQKQRLAISRAICRDPEIYIFDDSFSALDFKTDKILRKRLKEEIKDATSLIVAQRIGTISDADKIIVLDEGKMVGIGTHSELLENCEIYKEIALSQLSKEELENE